ncbi:YeeE/YedE family protein [Thermosulfurimonas marina]|uniref:YeeE/YedE family protein n=1 Tax=Thermosulfurimonas marina TaxID=2047767 RepID=A0A6H1WS86_9BACT|nr:YeeE/YedE thiosulfate transporter family protein [Thermosulfurimonas marina]QJA06019.1 YeeE/YedE family protein [Thermosulfurimonas marina]
MEPIVGLITGILWGYIFQRARILRFEKHIGLLTLTDLTVLKFLLSGVVVGTLGINLLATLGLAPYHLKPTFVAANFVGGVIYGLGWAILGYCPGTAPGAVGEGSLDGLFAVLGGLCGAAAFAHTYPFWKQTLYGIGGYGKVSFPQLLHLPPLLLAVLFAGLLLAFIFFLEKMGW